MLMGAQYARKCSGFNAIWYRKRTCKHNANSTNHGVNAALQENANELRGAHRPAFAFASVIAITAFPTSACVVIKDEKVLREVQSRGMQLSVRE